MERSRRLEAVKSVRARVVLNQYWVTVHAPSQIYTICMGEAGYSLPSVMRPPLGNGKTGFINRIALGEK